VPQSIARLIQNLAERERNQFQMRVEANLHILREGGQQPILMRGGYLRQSDHFRDAGRRELPLLEDSAT
jgi:hypothetical protein